jgi:hypothetical protein
VEQQKRCTCEKCSIASHLAEQKDLNKGHLRPEKQKRKRKTWIYQVFMCEQKNRRIIKNG